MDSFFRSYGSRALERSHGYSFRSIAWQALILAFLVFSLSVGCRSSTIPQKPDAMWSPCTFEWIGNIDRTEKWEHSGICFHPARGTLFVVGDEGDLYEISPEGTVIKTSLINQGADFEGVTLDPRTGLLYIAVEGEDSILEIDPETHAVQREFHLPRRFKGTMVLKEGGDGIEAITFIPNPDHPEGGTFLVANQSYDTSQGDDLSAVYEIVLPLRSHVNDPVIHKQLLPGVVDLAGLHYDSRTGRIFLISGTANLLMIYTPDLILETTCVLPGDLQEGVTLDDKGNLYIAQDGYGIQKYRFSGYR